MKLPNSATPVRKVTATTLARRAWANSRGETSGAAARRSTCPTATVAASATATSTGAHPGVAPLPAPTTQPPTTATRTGPSSQTGFGPRAAGARRRTHPEKQSHNADRQVDQKDRPPARDGRQEAAQADAAGSTTTRTRLSASLAAGAQFDSVEQLAIAATAATISPLPPQPLHRAKRDQRDQIRRQGARQPTPTAEAPVARPTNMRRRPQRSPRLPCTGVATATTSRYAAVARHRTRIAQVSTDGRQCRDRHAGIERSHRRPQHERGEGGVATAEKYMHIAHAMHADRTQSR